MEAFTIHLSPFFEWLLKTTIQGSILVCLVLLVKVVLGQKLPIRWHYYLWLLLLIRLALPWSPQSRISIFNLMPQSSSQQNKEAVKIIEESSDGIVHSEEGTSDTGQSEPIPGQMSGAEMVQSESLPASNSVSETVTTGTDKKPPVVIQPIRSQIIGLTDILPLIWLAGALILAGYILLRNIILWRAIKSERQVTDQDILELLEDCKMQMRIQTVVGVVVTDKVKSPALFGFVRPRLLLPQGLLEELDLDELQYVFLHELAHLRRRDIYFGWIVSLLQVLHWFNPLIWFAFRRMRTDQELACDALALSTMGVEEPQQYGRTLVNLFERFSQVNYVPSIAGILEDKSQLERRIKMITKYKKSSYRWSPLAVILIFILACVSLPDPQNGMALGSIISGNRNRITLRRIIEYKSEFSKVSPDGRYLCGTRMYDDILCLYALELDTGIRKILVRSDPNSGRIWSGDPSISVDSTMVAYRWWDNEKNMPVLQIIGMDGSNRRTLVSKRIFPKNWSSDGRRILGLRPHIEAGSELVWVSTDKGSFSIIKTLPKERGVLASRVDLSPDERYIAYDARNPEVGLQKWDIFLFDIDKNLETALEYPGSNRLVGWTPDGKYILFTSDHDETQDLLLMPIVDGKSERKSKVVRRNIGSFRAIGLTQGGTCFYTTAYRSNTLYTAILDLNMGRLLSSPEPVMQRQDSYGCIAWSPDGEYLSYTEGSKIHIKSLTGSVDRVINTGLPPFRWISWNPTGEFIIVSFLSPGGGGSITTDMMWSVHQIDVETGEKSVLFKSDIGRPIRSEFSPDGKRIIYNCVQAKPHDSLVIRDLDTGKERIIFEFSEQSGWKYWWDLSLDGKYIAIGAPGVESPSQLKIISIEGKELKELLPQDWDKIFDVIWTPDGKTVLFTSQGALWQISAEGGELRKLLTSNGLGAASHPSICLHPDGQRIDFSGSEYSEELWVMENFLPETPVAKSEPTPTLKQIWAGPDVDIEGAVSPDGRYISYVDWDTGDLAIYEIATGKKQRLTNKGSWDESDEYAEFSTWSPDGKKIVYDWCNKEYFIELRLVGLDGSEPRILYRNKEVGWAQTYDWSPDGKQILACFSNKGLDQIVLVSVADRSVRVLKTLNKGYPQNMVFSPDGRYIVYDFPQKENSPESDIFLLSVDGSHGIPLIEHPANDRFLDWTPDGKNILFTSDRTGSPCMWSIAIADGIVHGIPRLVKPNTGLRLISMGFTKDGSFYYGCGGRGMSDVYTARLDLQTGKVLSPPKKAVLRFEGHNGTGNYSPDGKYLAYVSHRGIRHQILCIRSLETGQEREFPSKLKRVLGPQWSPDGDSILIAGMDYDINRYGIYQVDPKTGIFTPVMLPSKDFRFNSHEWSRDGKSFFLGRTSREDKYSQIMLREINSGKEEEIYRTSGLEQFRLACSPDGKWLAFINMRNDSALRIIPSAGGEPRELYSCVPNKEQLLNLKWTADGKYILFVKRKIEQKGLNLWKIPVEGGESQKIDLGINTLGLSIHPDGQHIAFGSRENQPAEVWVMENFLPKETVTSQR